MNDEFVLVRCVVSINHINPSGLLAVFALNTLHSHWWCCCQGCLDFPKTKVVTVAKRPLWTYSFDGLPGVTGTDTFGWSGLFGESAPHVCCNSFIHLFRRSTECGSCHWDFGLVFRGHIDFEALLGSSTVWRPIRPFVGLAGWGIVRSSILLRTLPVTKWQWKWNLDLAGISVGLFALLCQRCVVWCDQTWCKHLGMAVNAGTLYSTGSGLLGARSQGFTRSFRHSSHVLRHPFRGATGRCSGRSLAKPGDFIRCCFDRRIFATRRGCWE